MKNLSILFLEIVGLILGIIIPFFLFEEYKIKVLAIELVLLMVFIIKFYKVKMPFMITKPYTYNLINCLLGIISFITLFVLIIIPISYHIVFDYVLKGKDLEGYDAYIDYSILNMLIVFGVIFYAVLNVLFYFYNSSKLQKIVDKNDK